jgi:uncharacterized protein YktB (UPF0637 family)
MKKEEKEVLEKWEKLIKGLFEDAELKIKDKEDPKTFNFLISITWNNNEQKKNENPKIVAITKETIDKYLSLSQASKKIIDQNFYQCIKAGEKLIKPKDLNLDYYLGK